MNNKDQYGPFKDIAGQGLSEGLPSLLLYGCPTKKMT